MKAFNLAYNLAALLLQVFVFGQIGVRWDFIIGIPIHLALLVYWVHFEGRFTAWVDSLYQSEPTQPEAYSWSTK